MRGDLRISLVALLLTSAVQPQEVPIFRETATLVAVPCVVTDERGRTISDLTLDDFRLYVNGGRREITNAVTQLLERVIHQGDRGFVVAVNDSVILKSEVTQGQYGLRAKVLAQRDEPLGVQCGTLEGDHGRKRPVCGGTALWNAVYASAHLKLNGPAGNKALLILSDGNDTGSTHTFTDALEEVQRSGAVVYAIQYPDALNPDASSDELRRLTEETGGKLFELHGSDYSQIISRIATDLRGRYILGFRPASTENENQRHSLKVEVIRPGATVRARREYFGP